MSRRIDEETKKRIKDGDHEAVFRDICGILGEQHQDLLEIEMLGISHQTEHHQNYLQDGNAIAFPKLRLIQAFIVARQKLPKQANSSAISEEEVLGATAVTLLLDPEHLTAANLRKRILTNRGECLELLHREQYFVDSLLTSRLHRHTKSPVLWNHRRWLMDRLLASGETPDVEDTLRRVVFVSAERHPRNYYAWSHARYLKDIASTAPPGQPVQQQRQTLITMLDDTKRWCFQHHDDVSGWAFLQVLIESCPKRAGAVFEETLGLAESFHWRGESVWYFLRNLTCSGLPRDRERTHVEFLRLNAKLREGTLERSIERTVLDKSAAWVAAERNIYSPGFVG